MQKQNLFINISMGIILCVLVANVIVLTTMSTYPFSTPKRYGLKDYEVIKIENCQYIRFQVGDGKYTITHKGDCQNPIHYRIIFKDRADTVFVDSLKTRVYLFDKLYKPYNNDKIKFNFKF